ncbi:CAAX protease [Candidatus Epulonipiscium fishelsonii]|uniref:CAAX protease n=1 Tax=Candidatus Epulonipiscium fishelsonii TaxID=77094 RepID=A0ACC8XC72_9FIRM|nr:CAAX protease [Epulopiscium sp. SCG-B11WGA-EpuloA1]ONI43190.1 CAAX protease [Epulopiscium sp. SCG-B05WGA-EpuloA1]
MKYYITSIVIINCVIMGIVDAIITPQYFIKSFIKVLLFTIVPLIFYVKSKDTSLKTMFTPKKNGIITSLVIGVIIFVAIIASYFGFKNIFDFSNITASLTQDIGVNLDNFILVFLYINFINSFLEEFFFRGFAFLTLKRYTTKKFSYVFSSLTFSLYHIAMIFTWVSPVLVTLAVVGLFIGGVIFDYINDRYENIYASWIIHMFANLGINTVGFILFTG